jgi:hypothetical protein
MKPDGIRHWFVVSVSAGSNPVIHPIPVLSRSGEVWLGAVGLGQVGFGTIHKRRDSS